jgi:branched-chain amino acid transport system substrate-binding protein
LLAACGDGNIAATEEDAAMYDERETVVLGSVFANSGEYSAYGQPQTNAVEMAVDEINEEGGVNGKNIEIVAYDYSSDETEAATLATRLATEDQVSLIIGPDTSGSSLAALQQAMQYNMPLLSPSASLDDFTVDSSGEVIDTAWRIAYSDSYQGEALAQFAADEFGAESAAILGDNSSDYAVGLVETFESAFPGEIVAKENFTADETDFSAVLTNIANSDFDVLFVPGYYEQAGPIIRQAREMGIEQPILGPDGFGNSQLYELAGTANLNDVYYTTQFSTLSEEEHVQEFLANYEERFGQPADMFAAMAYDATYVVRDAIERAGSAAPSAINAELANTENFEGVTGTFSFDELHNPVKSVTIVEVQNGEDVGVIEVDAE